MTILLTIVHILVCLFLVIVVLLQHGKAADLAGAFGGMGSQTFFGPRGAATALSKATTVAAVLFMITSLSLAILATRGSGKAPGSTVLEQVKPEQAKPATSPQGGTTVPLTLPGQEGAPAKGQTAPTGGAPANQAPAPPANTPASPPAK